ncbi:MAG: D-glycero-beta-D-manno-heptose 1,7-bisphosphate 7-phosphatase [Halofilum sp. (in: g-proteobacteria)]|nr:D-glycero-beta-D-manno-heptose 1,7-bisphosphate 7-phosphatase [Halofilum sp. (in: g-proteobacteria)]
MSRGLVILDRDGVLNAESPDHIKSVEEWLPLPGSLEAVARLCRAHVRVALATNQSGIARGLFDEADLQAIHRHINAELGRIGGRLDPIVYSPDGPGSNSPRRKPNPGMLHEIAARCGVDLNGVPFVGDSWRDIEAARAAGARPVLVRTGNGRTTEREAPDLSGVEVYDDLAAFVDHYLREGAA